MKTLESQKLFPNIGRAGSLPNLVIVGAMKCGTSSLHRYLDFHPQIKMSSIKELDFFIEEKNWHRGESWYRSHFPVKADILGESSPNYTKFPVFSGVPERMHRMLPDAKLIYLVRDPIERIISHYFHQYTDRAEHRSLEDALNNFDLNHYVFTSQYGLQIEKILEYYDESQLMIIDLVDLSNQPLQVLKKVFEFLGVDSSFTHPSFHEVFHRSKQKQRLTRLGEAVFSLPAGGRLMTVMPNLLAKDVSWPVMNNNLRNKLLDYLSSDMKKFETLVKKRFWNYS